MSLLSSMNTGITALQGQGEALSVYGDNIANANTAGFKVSRPEFQDVISQSIGGALGGNQIGHGARLANVNPIFSQGSIVQTESPTDLAITGDGFFTMSGPEGQTFTRNGAFHFNKDGKLVNGDGSRVQGFLADDKGKMTSKLGDIAIDRSVIEAQRTSDVKLFMNLDLRAEKGPEFDPTHPDETSQFATSATVYDSAGTPHAVNLYFNKAEDGSWSWKAMAKGEEVIGGKRGAMIEQARGRLTFDPSGRLKEQKTENTSFNFNKGALQDQKIRFNFGDDQTHGGTGVQVTQYGSTSEVYKSTQDGFSAGSLAGLNFSDDGTLTATYTNGQNLSLAQVVLAKFENPEGLHKGGQNRYRESPISGQPSIGAARTGGRGQISSKTIESSTTDIAAEFINLMQAQRTFQANGKLISTADEMMQDVLNMKKS